MGLLDKLKPQPRWKHTDPAIRLEAVKDVDDLQELAQLALLDPDGRVRRAAVARLDDAEVLGRISGQDPDPETRERATDRLMLMAGQVLLIARAKFDDVLRKRVELLEKKEPAKK